VQVTKDRGRLFLMRHASGMPCVAELPFKDAICSQSDFYGVLHLPVFVPLGRDRMTKLIMPLGRKLFVQIIQAGPEMSGKTTVRLSSL
jgi:hypothetical protein